MNTFTAPELSLISKGLAALNSCYLMQENECGVFEELTAKLDKLIVAEHAREQAESDLKRDLQSANLYAYLAMEPTPDMPKVRRAFYLLNKPADEEIGRTCA